MHVISMRDPSLSRVRRTVPGMASKKAGHPQPALNFVVERYRGAWHPAHVYTPCSEWELKEPVPGASVPLFVITEYYVYRYASTPF